jgi:hypothetical protein
MLLILKEGKEAIENKRLQKEKDIITILMTCKCKVRLKTRFPQKESLKIHKKENSR